MKKNNLTNSIKRTLFILGLGLLSSGAMSQIGGIKVKNPIKTGTGENKTETTGSGTTTTTGSGNTSDNTIGTNNTVKANDTKSIKVTAPTLIVTTELGGTVATPEIFASDRIFLRFAFPKPVGPFFAEAMELESVPSTGSFVLAIGQNADDENPIVISVGDIFTSRYASDNMIDFVLQGDEKLWSQLERPDDEIESKVSFNSMTTMAQVGHSTQWLDKALFFGNKTYEWEVFLYFMPWGNEDESKVKLVTSAKFKFTMTAEGKTAMINNLNFYDKQRFEKTPDDGIVTSVHKANINKMVFSNQKMLKDFDDASALKATFPNFSGGIYARLYLKESMRNFFANYGLGKDVGKASYHLYFHVDGETTYRCYSDGELSKEEAHSLTSWSIPLAPINNDDYEYDPGCVNRFAYVMSELADGKHTITIKVIYHGGAGRDTGEEFARGEFTVNVAQADRDAFVKKYGLQMPSKGLLENDSKLFAEVKKIAGPSAIDVRCPNEWENKFNALGQLTHRVTIVCSSFKDETGRCKMGTFMIEQVKNANGFGPTTSSLEKTWFAVDNYLPFQNSK